MTIAFKKGDQDKFIEFTCDEKKITHKEYQEVLIPTMDKLFKDYGTLRALVDMRTYGGMELRAMWDDFWYGMKHLKDVERVATVGDQKWVEISMKTMNHIYKMELKHFHSDQMEEAKAWLNSDV